MPDANNLPGHDLSGYLTNYPREAALGDEAPEAVFDRYHTSDFVLFNDGIELDRDKMLAHMSPARKNTTDVNTQIHQMVATDDQIAARYTLVAEMRKGPAVTSNVYMFGQLAPDGRLRRLDQMTTVSQGDE